MRITSSMLARTLINSVNSSKERLARLQGELATGKRINKPSDDPLGITQALGLQARLRKNAQYLKNSHIANNWVDQTSQILASVAVVLNNAKVITVRESTATASEQSHSASAEEVRSIKGQILNLINTQQAGRYLFAGSKTRTKPFNQQGTYQGDEGEIKIQVAQGTSFTINVPGNQLLQGQENIFAVLSELETALENNNAAGISGTMDKIDSCLEQIYIWEGNFGGKGQKVQIFQNRLQDQEVGITQLLSYTEDADVVRTIVELQMVETGLKAALDAGMAIMRIIMLEFWR